MFIVSMEWAVYTSHPPKYRPNLWYIRLGSAVGNTFMFWKHYSISRLCLYSNYYILYLKTGFENDNPFSVVLYSYKGKVLFLKEQRKLAKHKWVTKNKNWLLRTIIPQNGTNAKKANRFWTSSARIATFVVRETHLTFRAVGHGWVNKTDGWQTCLTDNDYLVDFSSKAEKFICHKC